MARQQRFADKERRYNERVEFTATTVRLIDHFLQYTKNSVCEFVSLHVVNR